MTLNCFSTATDMLVELVAKRVSARELLDLHVGRHLATHAKVNAVVRVDLERARSEAGAVDDARARGEVVAPLAGLPMTVKDAFDVEGLPAHSGNPALANRSSQCGDAEVVGRARRAGAVIWGKTNVPYMLEEWQSFNALYGVTNNPHDLARTPGGSSGGSAAALAAGATPLEIGSDIGGSLRIPAHYCGVCSCKPTWGTLPQAGHIIRMPDKDPNVDLNVAGPMARTIADLRLLFGVLSERQIAENPVAGLRVACWTDAPGLLLGADARAAVETAGDALSRAGAKTTVTRPPVDMRRLLVAYRDLLMSILGETTRDLPPAWVLKTMRPVFGLQRALGAGPLSFAGYGRALAATDATLARARRTRDALKARMTAFFREHELILAPVAPGPAFEHNQRGALISRTYVIDGKRAPMVSNLHWIALATALHLPAVVVPAGRTAEGLPLGVQLIGPWNSEDRLFDVAAEIERRLGGFAAPRNL